jgi:hypothetical protein
MRRAPEILISQSSTQLDDDELSELLQEIRLLRGKSFKITSNFRTESWISLERIEVLEVEHANLQDIVFTAAVDREQACKKFL